MVAPIRNFKTLDDCPTPLGKLHVLKDTNTLIMKTVESSCLASKWHTQSRTQLTSCRHSLEEDVTVTTDDLIPYLVYIIILAKPKHLHSTLWFMENLTFTNLSSSELG